jgi:hypothetical protein
MTLEPTEKTERMRRQRDTKVRPHLEQYAPVWLVDELLIPKDDAIQFNVVFHHPAYGWVNRRYRYDAFNDVLYHKGQNVIDENEALALEQKRPYIDAETINTINSYGG